jgi:uncharacterized protein YkwD
MEINAFSRSVKQVARRLRKPVPIVDTRLCDVAKDMARFIHLVGDVDISVSQLALDHHGIAEPTPAMVIGFTTGNHLQTSVARTGPQLAQIYQQGIYKRFGVGTYQGSSNNSSFVVLLLESFIDFDPIPRILGPTGSFNLSARLSPAYKNPRVAITTQTGNVKNSKIKKKGNSFVSQIKCLARGRQKIEILAEADHGPKVLANFAVYCGVEPPRKIVFQINSRHQGTAESMETQMVGLINKERKKASLPLLKVDPRLVKVARGHSQEMVRTQVVAHKLDSTGTAKDRLNQAGIHVAMIAENISRSSSVLASHNGLMESPGHRANILRPNATHVGVGIETKPKDHGQEIYVTELFVRIPPPLNRAHARRAITKIVSVQTKLKRDAVLGGWAQRQADAMAKGADAQAAFRLSTHNVNPIKRSYLRLRSLVHVVANIQDFRLAQAIKNDTSLTHYGIGMSQGRNKKLGEQAISIVLFLAQKKP